MRPPRLTEPIRAQDTGRGQRFEGRSLPVLGELPPASATTAAHIGYAKLRRQQADNYHGDPGRPRGLIPPGGQSESAVPSTRLRRAQPPSRAPGGAGMSPPGNAGGSLTPCGVAPRAPSHGRFAGCRPPLSGRAAGFTPFPAARCISHPKQQGRPDGTAAHLSTVD